MRLTRAGRGDFIWAVLCAACVIIGCSSGGSAGCNGKDRETGEPTVDSQLLGIYRVDGYQRSEGTCEELVEVADRPSRLVLYSVPSTRKPQEARLVGQFCGSVEDCRRRVRKLPMVMNWSFFEGSDAAGWRGWGIASRAMSGGKCLADVQAHELHSRGSNAIHIQSRQVAAEFEPSAPRKDGAQAMCGVQAAIDSIGPESPCTGHSRSTPSVPNRRAPDSS